MIMNYEKNTFLYFYMNSTEIINSELHALCGAIISYQSKANTNSEMNNPISREITNMTRLIGRTRASGKRSRNFVG